MDLCTLEGVSILREVMFNWIDEVAVVEFDSACCNQSIRSTILRILSLPFCGLLNNNHDDNVHRSTSSLYIGFKTDVDMDPASDQLRPWARDRLNWIYARNISVSRLKLGNVDLSQSFETSVDKLNLTFVKDLSVCEKVYFKSDRYWFKTRLINGGASESDRANKLTDIVTRCPQLTRLWIDNSTRACHELVQKMPQGILTQLTSLVLKMKCATNDFALIGQLMSHIAHCCVHLKVVRLMDANSVYQPGLPHTEETFAISLQKLIKGNQSLYQFEIELDVAVTSHILLNLAENCPHLKVLSCSLVWLNTDLSYIASILNRCKHMERLNVVGCGVDSCRVQYNPTNGLLIGWFIRDNLNCCTAHSVIMMLQMLHEPLLQLRLYNSQLVDTDDSIVTFIRKHNPNLESFRGCNFVLFYSIISLDLQHSSSPSHNAMDKIIQHYYSKKKRGEGIWSRLCETYFPFND